MKKLVAITIVAMLLCLKAAPAVVEGGTLSSGAPSGATNLSYSVTQRYTITIPENFSSAGKEGTGDVVLSAASLIESGKKLLIKVNGGEHYSSGYRMQNGVDEYVAYTLSYKVGGETYTNISIENTEILSVNAGDQEAKTVNLKFNVTGTETVAGSYKDKLTFTVSVENQ